MQTLTTALEFRRQVVTGLSGISQFWGFPRGMGALFGVLYLSPEALSLDELAAQSGLTKGAVSTTMRALARLGLVHPVHRLADRKDYYEAETDFYKSIRAILRERQDREFDRALGSVRAALQRLEAGEGQFRPEERAFLVSRLRALGEFFDALDRLTRAVAALDSLGGGTIKKLLHILK